ncbi:MAG TPA: hypothetical protein VFW17_12100 [Ktedonobacterales bacterium]|nr:hypothetical protein [Ktedonobacterales bacterium]
MVKRHHMRGLTPLVTLALVALLGACGQTSTRNRTNASAKALKTPSAVSVGTATPTDVPLPYSFPKRWLPAPDGADLPQFPSTIGSIEFSPSSPQTGYLCVVSPDSVNDSPSAPPFVSVTHDSGQSWEAASGAGSSFKTACHILIDQNDPSDVFVEAGKSIPGAGPSLPFFRSQNGGATWKTIKLPILTNGTTYVSSVATVQSRLIVMLGFDGEAGPTTSTLYSSDDGGQTWQQINLVVNGQTMQLGELWISGTTLIIAAGSACQGACGALQAPIRSQRGIRPLSVPLSSQPPSPNYYFKSTDGGRSWTAIATPISNLANLMIARSSDGSATYLVGVGPGTSSQSLMNQVGYYSKDGGATWRQLPMFAGVENGYPDPYSFGAFDTDILPDGSVMTTPFHTTGTNSGNNAGVFLIHPSDPTPTWQPLIRSFNAVAVYPVATATGIRVWGLTMSPNQAGGFLNYFDLP